VLSVQELPKLADDTIQEVIRTQYGILVTRLTFLPLGNDTMSFVYQISTDDARAYFLKVRTGSGFHAASLHIPRFFYEQGLPHVIPPLPTITGALWVGVDTFCLALYPLIMAATAAAAGLLPEHWRSLGTTLKRIHSADLPPNLRELVRQETYVPWRREVLTELETVLTQQQRRDSPQRALATFWQERRAEIHSLIARCDILAHELRAAALPHVVCHADLHTWNLLRDTTDQLWIVDWDEIVLAPKERDLMFVIDGIGQGLVSAHATACFLQGYGESQIDRRALAYYRYAWVVQELGAYVEEVFFAPDRSEQARTAAVQSLIGLFEPGQIVAIARSSTDGLP
jgi:spectinomycin phosphotransferase